jgi:hypothetical protein
MRLASRLASAPCAWRHGSSARHAPGVTTRQHAELFVGGLPDHIRVNVELHDP